MSETNQNPVTHRLQAPIHIFRDKSLYTKFVAEHKEHKDIKACLIDEIKTNKLNPHSRTNEDAKLRKLANSIQTLGLLNPIQLSNDLVTLDGHRRQAALKLIEVWPVDYFIGITYPNIKSDTNGKEMQQIFVEINQWTKPFSPANQLEAAMHPTYDGTHPNATIQRAKDNFNKWNEGDEDLYEQFVGAGCPPMVVHNVVAFAKLTSDYKVSTTFKLFRDIMGWQLEKTQQHALKLEIAALRSMTKAGMLDDVRVRLEKIKKYPYNNEVLEQKISG